METSTRRRGPPRRVRPTPDLPVGAGGLTREGSTPSDGMDTEGPCAESLSSNLYSRMGRPSIPPEHLLKGCLLMCLYSIRSERQLCERLRYDMLFRFFLELQVDGPTFDPSGFAHNRDRLLQADVARLFFEGVLRQAKSAQLISKEHFTVDGTLMEAWASLKSFKPKTKFTGKSVRTKLTSPRRTRRPSWLEREAAQRCFLIPGISSWRIATGCVSMSVWELLMGTRSASTL